MAPQIMDAPALGYTPTGLQKACDYSDWSDPAIDDVIRNELKQVPRLRRKQWEFAVIYLALKRCGVLTPESEGISFGAGHETVLFVVAEKVRRLWATDLYNDSTVWDTANTEATRSARDFVMEFAPKTLDPERIEVRDMDMRTIEFEDNRFDFAYSSCAIEHIGVREDFLRHFREVRRVLKPGGVYVCTTELGFADQTVPYPHNHRFSPQDLLSLISEAGLSAEPELDLRIARNLTNAPIPDLHAIKSPLATATWLPHLAISSGGLATTSCCLVIRKLETASPTTFDEAAWKAHREWGIGRLAAGTSALFADWHVLDHVGGLHAEIRQRLFGHDEFIRPAAVAGIKRVLGGWTRAAQTRMVYFGEDGEVDIRVLGRLDPEIKNHKAMVRIRVEAMNLPNESRRDLVLEQDMPLSDLARGALAVRFPALASKSYSIQLLASNHNDWKVADLMLQARRVR